MSLERVLIYRQDEAPCLLVKDLNIFIAEIHQPVKEVKTGDVVAIFIVLLDLLSPGFLPAHVRTGSQPLCRV